MEEAAKRGYTIYWGNVGFSVRVLIAGRLASFVYGYPKDRFEFYTTALHLTESEQQQLREDVAQQGTFQRAGTNGLKAQLQGATLSWIDQAYTYIVEKVEAVKAENERVAQPSISPMPDE